MRILGIDYGTKRVGVAVSDPTGKFALPVVVLKSDKSLLDEVRSLASANEATEVVLGESRKYDMTANKILPAALAFKSDLERAGLTVHLEPEFMTSVHAEEFQGKGALTDASAAALILQRFLDRRSNKAGLAVDDMISQ